MNYIRNTSMRAFILICFSLLLMMLLYHDVHARPDSRFDFSKSLRHVENFESQQIEKILLDSSLEQLKAFRKQQIENQFRSPILSYGVGKTAYVTALFDITGLVPSNFDAWKHQKSVIKPTVESLWKMLTEEEKRYSYLEILGNPSFHSEYKSTSFFEQIDLKLSAHLLDHLLGTAGLVDVTITNTFGAISFPASTPRFTPAERSMVYESEFLRRGYYKEIKEALLNAKKVDVHVQLQSSLEDIPQYSRDKYEPEELSVEAVIKSIAEEDIKFARMSGNEFLATLNKKSVQTLYHDPRVKLMQDYLYHHQLQLSRGQWRPLPLSETRRTTYKEITQIEFEQRTYLLDQPTLVIESHSQLERLSKIMASGFNKTRYLDLVDNSKIDFSQSNLVIYSQQETSGSIGLAPQRPIWVDDQLVVPMDRYVPELLTADMARHIFVYSVDKNIPTIVIRSASKEFKFNNKFSGLEGIQKVVTRDKLARERYFKEKD